MKIKNILLVSCGILSLTSCNKFLDLVPEKDITTIPSIYEVRKNVKEQEADCYAYIQSLANPAYNIGMMGSDEWVANQYSRDYGQGQSGTSLSWANISDGLQNVQSPIDNKWTQSGYFNGLRYINLFLQYVPSTYDMSQDEKKEWMAEIKVLKAFIYFQLVKRYGPIILVPENIAANATLDEMKQPRQPIDSCFNAIVSLIDDALKDGLLSRSQQLTSHQAYFNHESALALKAVVLTYAASPLFNGNTDFADFKNKNGEQLFPQQYDPEKWHKAAVACDEAIKACEANGYKLISSNKSPFGTTQLLNTMTDLEKRSQAPGYNNSEMIFGVKTSNTFMYYSDKLYSWILPYMKSTDYNNYDANNLGCLAPSMKMVEMYYTDKGLPIDEDPSWDYASRYTGMSQETYQAKYDKVIPAGTNVLNLHLRREPRFYADIAADRTYFQRGPAKAHPWSPDYNLLVKAYKDESFGTSASAIQEDIPQNLTGYWVKKSLYSDLQGKGYKNNYPSKGSDDPFALITLPELYLMDAEAWNEYEGPSEKVYAQINKVRERAGIPDVQTSWRLSKHPGKISTKDGMRSIIQQETNIELAFQGQRYFNLLRWKKGEELGQPAYGWNIIGESATSFYNNWHGPIVVWNKRKFISPRDYFHPIRTEEVQISGVKQNPGW
jgi:hypothetical protein